MFTIRGSLKTSDVEIIPQFHSHLALKDGILKYLKNFYFCKCYSLERSSLRQYMKTPLASHYIFGWKNLGFFF